MHVVLVSLLSPGVPSITEYFTFATLEIVSGTSELLKLVSVSDGGGARSEQEVFVIGHD